MTARGYGRAYGTDGSVRDPRINSRKDTLQGIRSRLFRRHSILRLILLRKIHLFFDYHPSSITYSILIKRCKTVCTHSQVLRKCLAISEISRIDDRYFFRAYFTNGGPLTYARIKLKRLCSSVFYSQNDFRFSKPHEVNFVE